MIEVLINGSQGKLQGFYKHTENSKNIGLVLHPRKCTENSMDNTSAIDMAAMEKNMTWISLCIATAPMLGFLGTVWCMIQAFNDIKMANDISPAVVAGGISQALLTTAFGLIVAMIMQVAQNFFVSMIDKLILDMEEQSIKIVEYLHSSKK